MRLPCETFVLISASVLLNNAAEELILLV
jgi:hypothetical protein